jgi:glycosyltransferase involved in cell wall biosynthesis
MAVGTPVVASRTPDQEDVLNTSNAGIVVDYDPSVFSEGITRLLSNKELRCRMGSAGVKYLQSNRNFNRLTDKVEKIYTDILND